jgi:hypothetical protein
MALLLHKDRPVAALEDMTHSIVEAVEPLRVHAVQLTHTFRKIRLRRLNEQMVMVGHQTVGVHPPVEAFPNVAEHIEKESPVVIGQKDVFAPVASCRDVV